MKIAEDGEILVKGPNVMKGCMQQSGNTAEAIDAEGWFHTGDIGEFVEGKFLRKLPIAKKEIFASYGDGKKKETQLFHNFSEK
ncbi:MAG: AMP-binding protein [Crocinitomicaceae bacterium]